MLLIIECYAKLMRMLLIDECYPTRILAVCYTIVVLIEYYIVCC